MTRSDTSSPLIDGQWRPSSAAAQDAGTGARARLKPAALDLHTETKSARIALDR